MKERTFKMLIFAFIVCSTQIVDIFIYYFGDAVFFSIFPTGWIIRFTLLAILVYTIWPISVGSLKKSVLVRPLLIYTFYIFFSSIINGYALLGLSQSLRILMLILTFYAGYYMTKNKMLGDLQLEMICWTILVITMINQLAGYFLTDIRAYQSLYAMSGLSEMPTGPAYSYVSIFPFFIRRHILKLKDGIALFLILFFSLATLRRSSYLVIIVVFFIYTYFALRNSHFNYRKIFTSSILFIISVGLYFIITRAPIGKDFILRFEEIIPYTGGTSSGRFVFWHAAISYLPRLDVINMLFGEGIGNLRNTMYHLIGHSVGTHNLWLDVILSFGFIGLALLIFYYYKFAKIALTSMKRGENFLLYAFVIYVLMGATTGAGFSPQFLPLYACVGHTIAKNQLVNTK